MADAEVSPPWPLLVSTSKLPRVGLGVITSEALPCCSLFGPFQGKLCQAYYLYFTVGM